MSMLKTETNIHTDEVIHRARAPTVALAKNETHLFLSNESDGPAYLFQGKICWINAQLASRSAIILWRLQQL